MGGVSWLPAKLFDLEHDPWMGLPCTPRPKVRYFGTDETVLSEEMVLQHAIARQLQSSLKVGDPRVANELVHSDQLAARAYFHRAKVLDPPAASYGGEGPEQVLGFFVSGMDSPSLCYVVVRAVPALLEGAGAPPPPRTQRPAGWG